MGNYQLKMSDYRYAKEKPVLIGTMTISIVLVLLMFLIYPPLGIGFLISIGLLFLNLHSAQIKMLGVCVKVSENQFPNVYRMARISADRLDMKLPPVYILQSPIINAFATGFFGHYYVVLHSAILEACTDEELMFIIGHEFSHVKGNHVMLNALMNMGVGNGMRLFPGLSWLQIIIQFVFLYLSRCFEYTCDRGGLIANGDVKAYITCQTKLAVGKELFNNINIMEFYKQALELDKKPFGFMAELEATHPLTVNRIRHAVRYYRSDGYRRIATMQGKSGTATLQGSLATGDLLQRIINKPEKQRQNVQNSNSNRQPNQAVSKGNSSPVQQTAAEFCSSCGTPKKNNAAFCVSCGAKFGKQILNTVPVNEVQEDFVPIIEVEEIPSGRICMKCGTSNQAQAMFCTECGEKF